jgi:cytochrome c553
MNCRQSPLIIFPVFLLLLVSCQVYAAGEDPGEGQVAHSGYSHNQIKRGQVLFYGLIPLGDNAASCAGCHNTMELDTLNWNPSAYDIAVTSHEKSLEEFSAEILRPEGQKMAEVHKNYNISDKDLELIKAYLEEVREAGLKPMKPAVIQRFLYLLAIAVFLLALTDLIVLKKVRYRFIHALVLLATLAWVVNDTVRAAIDVGRSPGYAPDQPIKFSHAIHAGQNRMNCLYCHNTAEYSKSAGIPSAGVCQNCHKLVVREGSRSGSFEINKINKAVATGKPIVWNRVYALPDHVFFSHAQHVGVGKIKCQTCHGPVEKMDILQQYTDLSMGWCINCHRETKVQFMDNKFYESYVKLHKEIKAGRKTGVTVEDIGGTECMKCHY